MKTYHWKSERFADYLDGDIIVRASSVESARKKADKEYRRQYDVSDTYDRRQYVEFLSDIATEPDEIEVQFMYGSS